MNLEAIGHCKSCDSPKPFAHLVCGTCIFCEPKLVAEKTHVECGCCGEMKRELVEVEMAPLFPGGLGLIEMCEECAQDLQDDPKGFFYRDPD